MDNVTCKLFMHLGGKLEQDPLKYVGGNVLQWEVHPDKLSMSTFSAMVSAAGFKEVKHFCYVEPGLQFRTGLRVCYDVGSFKRLLTHMRVLDAMHIYVEHHERDDRMGDDDEHVNDVVEDSLSNGDENSWDSDDRRGDVAFNYIADLGYITGKNLLKNPEGIQAAHAALLKSKAYSINENAPDLCNPDASSSDCIGSDEPAELSVEDDGEVVVKRRSKTYYDADEGAGRLELGMIFQDYKEFKHALAKYCIQNHFDIKYEKNEEAVVSAHCKADFCPFRVVARFDNRDDTFKLKVFETYHECQRVFRNSRADYKYLAKEFIPKLKIIPDLTLEEMLNFAKEEWDLDVSKSTLGRAKKEALEQINGKVGEEFNRLFDYVKELRTVDLNGNFELMVERASQSCPINFRRLYIGFSNLREGFLKFCRPILCLDGCFLKGNWEGEILCAVGRDGNDHIYPIAWAVVEKETRESWGWFLANLKKDLEIGEGEGYTFMTDQQKGLKQEIKEMFPRVEHRVCARHLYANWKVRYPGNDLRTGFWACVRATTQPAYELNLQRLKEMDSTSVDQLLKTDPKQWSRAFFSTRSNSDAVTNNHAESFNAAIKPCRGCSILTMVEAIRKYNMDRVFKYMKKSAKWGTIFTPTTEALLKENKKISGHCHVRWNGGEIFEIQCKGIQHVVNLSTWTCSCRKWELTGIPCPHAIASILWKKRNTADYVARWFKTETLKELYTNYPVPPVSAPDFWKRTNIGPILPPIKQAMPGRKKKNRIKEKGEMINKDGTKLTRAGYKYKCSLCNSRGHNKTSCPDKNKGTHNMGEASNSQALETDQTSNSPTQMTSTTGNSEVPQTQPVSTSEIPEELYTLYPTRQTSLVEELDAPHSTVVASQDPDDSSAPVQETGYTLYTPRPTEQKKKMQSKSTISASQPIPDSHTINEALPRHSSQPSSSTATNLSKFSMRGRDILDAAGISINDNETLTGVSNPRKRKAKPQLHPKTDAKDSKQAKKQAKGKANPIWKY